MPIKISLGKIVDRLISEYVSATKSQYVKKPFSYALHRTWKWCDAFEEERDLQKEERKDGHT